MTSKLKVAALIAAAAMVLVTPVFAQESNTSKSTAGVFKSDVDNSLNVHNYGKVEFEKWFGFVGYGTYSGVDNRPIQLGYATKVGGLYLGTWYSGNVVQIRDNPREQVTSNYSIDEQVQTDTVTVTTNGDKSVSSDNEIAALIGVAGMGIKVGFSEKAKTVSYPTDSNLFDNGSITATDNLGGTIRYNGEIIEYVENTTLLKPTIQWGMALNVGNITIKPRVKLGFGIGQYNQKFDFRDYDFSEVNGERVYDDGKDKIEYRGYNSNQLVPEGEVGARVEIGSVKIDAYYGLSLPIVNNKYDVAGFSGTVPGVVSWWGSSSSTETSVATTVTTNEAVLSINDLQYNDVIYTNHSISLGFGTDKEVATGLRLGVYGGVSANISTGTIESYDVTYKSVQTVYNHEALSAQNNTVETEIRTSTINKSVTQVYVTPYVNIGTTYNWFPNRFAVHAGVVVQPCRYSSTTVDLAYASYDEYNTQNRVTTTTREYNHQGELKDETVSVSTGSTDVTLDRSSVTNEVSYLSASIGAGFTFSFNNNVAFDLFANSGAQSGTFTLDAAELNVLLTFKF